MITFDRVSVTYSDAQSPVLRGASFTIPEGELCLLVGRTGAGKSTLLGAVNGLVPHFTGGTLAGTVTVAGRATREHPPREFADLVGVVGQDPSAGFVTDTVEEELAYGMEQLAVPPTTMRKRVEETLDLLGLAGLRHRALYQLSGGQQQRVAIGSVLTAHPKVLVLDEPTSALDPTAAEEVLATITRLVHDLGMTVLLAEHRLERVVQYADSVLYLPGDGSVEYGDPAAILAHTAVAPPIVELGRLAGWAPLPLSVRDARRHAAVLRERISAGKTSEVPSRESLAPAQPTHQTALSARDVLVRYDDVIAVRKVSLELHRGQICALMGRNGSGKSSLLWAVQGSGERHAGSVEVDGRDPAKLKASSRRALVTLVPQTAADLLCHDSVGAELTHAHSDGADPRSILDRLAPGISDDTHPRDLSEGQRLALVLAVMLAASPRVLLLDEPTRGLDYPGKQALSALLADLAATGMSIVVATHDVEFVAFSCDRVVVMAEGEVVADGTTREVVLASPALAPQVAKILAPVEVLTVAEVQQALAANEEQS